MDAFHGTIINLFQFPTKADPGENRSPVTISPLGTKQHSLPDSYAFDSYSRLHNCYPKLHSCYPEYSGVEKAMYLSQLQVPI